MLDFLIVLLLFLVVVDPITLVLFFENKRAIRQLNKRLDEELYFLNLDIDDLYKVLRKPDRERVAVIRKPRSTKFG